MRRRHSLRKRWAWVKDVFPRVDSGWEGDGAREKTWLREKMLSREKHVSLGMEEEMGSWKRCSLRRRWA
jgi:hypothetical protein